MARAFSADCLAFRYSDRRALCVGSARSQCLDQTLSPEPFDLSERALASREPASLLEPGREMWRLLANAPPVARPTHGGLGVVEGPEGGGASPAFTVAAATRNPPRSGCVHCGILIQQYSRVRRNGKLCHGVP